MRATASPPLARGGVMVRVSLPPVRRKGQRKGGLQGWELALASAAAHSRCDFLNAP
jgi:hypothetical protein